MNFIINNQEFFKQIHLHTILKQGISIIFTDHMPTYLVLKKSTFDAGIKIFNSLPTRFTTLRNDKAKFKAAIRKYLHTHSLLLCRWIFLRVKMIYNTIFCKMSVAYYTSNLYICVFMTCSTFNCLYDTLMDPWNEWTNEQMHACKRVCVCVWLLFKTMEMACKILSVLAVNEVSLKRNYLFMHSINRSQGFKSSGHLLFTKT